MGRLLKTFKPYREFISNLYLNKGFSREAIIKRLIMEFEFNTTVPNRASGLALNPLRPCGFSAYQRYGQKSAIRSFF
jgi:hypothetical protein